MEQFWTIKNRPQLSKIVSNCLKGGEKIEEEKANDSNSNHSYFIDVCFSI